MARAQQTRTDPRRKGDLAFEFWLGACDGFRVITITGDLGTVVASAKAPHETVLHVRTGRLRRRVLEIPTAHVDWIDPHQRCILLFKPSATED